MKIPLLRERERERETLLQCSLPSGSRDDGGESERLGCILVT